MRRPRSVGTHLGQCSGQTPPCRYPLRRSAFQSDSAPEGLFFIPSCEGENREASRTRRERSLPPRSSTSKDGRILRPLSHDAYPTVQPLAGRSSERPLTCRSQIEETRLRLEVQNDAGNALKAVLALAEESGIDPVCFQADRQPGMHTVVDPASGLHHQPRLARTRRLRLQVGTSHKHVTPRLPPRPPTSHTDPAPSSK